MIFYWLFLICVNLKRDKKKTSKEKYGKDIELLKKRIHIDSRDNEANENWKKMREAFGKNILQKEIEKIITSNKDEFVRVGLKILYDFNFNGAITQSGVIRCMRNLRFFSYAVLKMKDEFIEDFEKVKENYILNHH